MKFRDLFELTLSVIVSVFELLALLGFAACDVTDFFLFLGLRIELGFQILALLFSSTAFVLPIFVFSFKVFEVLVELVVNLLIFLYFELIVLVLADKGMQFYLFAFQCFDILVFVGDEVVESVYFLGEECDFVLVVFEVDLYVFVLADAVLKVAGFDSAIVELLLFVSYDDVQPLYLFGQSFSF